MSACEFVGRPRGRVIGVLIAAVLSSFLICAAPSVAQNIQVIINGQQMQFDTPPIEQAGRVFVPLRGVFENLGASVVYSNGVINATSGNQTIQLQIGSTTATVDGNSEQLDAAPFVQGDRTYVPLRFISEALGATVNWDDNTETVYISSSTAATYIGSPPPPLPYYQQPPAYAPNLIWNPGYWAFGPGGFFWVPGTWVPAPAPSLVWTPGYWSFSGFGFVWNQGYWGASIGFYGGVNYGAGYYGNGYVGGNWSGNTYSYNTAVTNVNTTVIKNVYVNKTVIINNNTTVNSVSYNGGAGGVQVQPTFTQRAFALQHHIPLTTLQLQHVNVAAQDRNLLVSVNHGKPPVLVVARPFTATHKPSDFVPITPADKLAALKLVKKRPLAAPAVHHTTAPLVHHTIAPMVRHSAAPVVTHTAAPMVHHFAPVVHHTVAPAIYHTPAPVVHHTAAPMVHHIVAPIVHHTPAPTVHHTPVPAIHHLAKPAVHHTPAPAVHHTPTPSPKPSA